MIFQLDGDVDTGLNHLFGLFWATNRLSTGPFYTMEFYHSTPDTDSATLAGQGEIYCELLWGEVDLEPAWRGIWDPKTLELSKHPWQMDGFGDYR
jgi:hypothetical protein